MNEMIGIGAGVGSGVLSLLLMVIAVLMCQAKKKQLTTTTTDDSVSLENFSGLVDCCVHYQNILTIVAITATDESQELPAGVLLSAPSHSTTLSRYAKLPSVMTHTHSTVVHYVNIGDATAGVVIATSQ
jgi:hypothetical protein